MNDANAKKQLVEIWDEARQGGLTEENMVAYIDSLESVLQQSQKLNFIRWPMMNQLVHQNFKIWGSYEAEVENVRDFMKERIDWMDRKLNYTYNPTGIIDMCVDTSKPYQVFTLSGRNCGDNINSQRPGIYILRQGMAVKKVIVR